MFKSVFIICVCLLFVMTQAPQFDLLIKNGRIVDGAGRAAYVADLAIKGDRIVSIGKLSEATATRTIDVRLKRLRKSACSLMFADITIFDPAKVIDRATFESPNQYPLGIEYVLVNGNISVDKGQRTSALAGRVLRGSGYNP